MIALRYPMLQRWARTGAPYGLAMLSGLLLAGSMPGTAVPGAWVLLLVPLLGALDLLAQRPGRAVARWLRALAACWSMGAVWAICTGDWLINTMHIFGDVPLILSHAVNVVGHGLLVGAEFFLTVGVPLLILRRWPALMLVFVPLWAAGVQAHLPRLFFWSWGQFMYPVPALVQAADLVGSAGLDLLHLPLQLVLYAGLRQALGRPLVPRGQWRAATAGVLALLVAAAGYGAWRRGDVARTQAEAPTARVVAVQPNFSLRHLASDPDASPSTRRQNLYALLADSDRALATMPPKPAGTPTIVVWPESVYPVAFREHEAARKLVEDWVRTQGVHLVLASIDFVPDRAAPPDQRRVYGGSFHLRPEGGPPGVYHKIVLMPWGEWIPFGEILPAYRRLLKAWIPRIAEFTPGREYTVFAIDDRVRVAPMICYDGTQTGVTRGMAANGANLAFVLANLGWFGPTTASLQFEHVIRFRAIENRLPLLFISQNGRTVFYDANAEQLAPPLGHFTEDFLALDVPVPEIGSIYTAWGVWIDRLFLLLGTLGLGLGIWRGRRQPPAEASEAPR